MKARPVTAEEYTAIRTHLPIMYRCLWDCLYGMGLRVSEALALTRGDVIDMDGNIRNHILVLQLKKRRTVRRVHVVPDALKVSIREWTDEQAVRWCKVLRSSFLFSAGLSDHPINRWSAWHQFKSAAIVAGIDPDGISCHTPRKTFSIDFYQFFAQNGDALDGVRSVQDLLGHESINTTLAYLNHKTTQKSDFEDALTKLDNHINGSLKE